MNNRKLFTVKELDLEKHFVDEAVSGLLKFPSLNVVYGPTRNLTSLLLMDMSVCVAKGQGWLMDSNGIATKTTTKLGVLWIDFDNDIQRTHDRFTAVRTHYGLDREESFYYMSMSAEDLGTIDTAGFKGLEDLIFPDVGMVVLDNLSATIGGFDLYSANVSPITAALRIVAERHRVVIVVAPAAGSYVCHPWLDAGIDCTLQVGNDLGTSRVTIDRLNHNESDADWHYGPLLGAVLRCTVHRSDTAEVWFEGMELAEIERLRELEDDATYSILDNEPCLLVYKNGSSSVCRVQDYTGTELMLLKQDSNYKPEWIAIGYGSYKDLVDLSYQIFREGLDAMGGEPVDAEKLNSKGAK